MGFYVMKKRSLIGSQLLFDLVMLFIVIGLVQMVPAASSNIASILLATGCIFYFLSKIVSGLVKLLFDDNYGF
jgi:hypothetical protein